MSTYQYQAVKNGTVIASWTSLQYGPEFWDASFGLPIRWVSEQDATPEEVASALSSKEDPMLKVGIVDASGDPVIDPATGLQTMRPLMLYQLPATYTVITTDITSQILQQQLDTYTAQRMTSADAAIASLLSGMTDTHVLMNALYELCVVVNPLGSFSATDITNSKAQIQTFLVLMGQINTIITQRDADIADYKTSLGLT